MRQTATRSRHERTTANKTSSTARQRPPGSGQGVLQLQQTLGNQAVLGLMETGRLSPAGRVSGLQRKCPGGCPDSDDEQAQATIMRTPAAPPALSPAMLEQITRQLHDAMAGLGTDEDAIYAALSGRTQAQVDAIAARYRARYGNDLYADLRDELTDDEMRHLATLSPSATEPASPDNADQARAARAARAEQVAARLDEAMRGWGTDENAIFAALTGRQGVEATAIMRAYRARTGRRLVADLNDELSGNDLRRALILLNGGELSAADEIFFGISGLGTDEDAVFRGLNRVAGDEAAIRSMEAEYRRKYGDLIGDLRGDLSGAEYRRAMAIIGSVLQDVAFEDCNNEAYGRQVREEIRRIIPLGKQKVENAINVLSVGWARMSQPQKDTFNNFFDPSGAGVDQRFVSRVLANYRKILREFDNDVVVECEAPGSSGMCVNGRLLYTYWGNVHVCPYWTTETDFDRKARDFVHELTHNALMALDRPYYDDSAGQYEGNSTLTPYGPAGSGDGLINDLIRVISRTDTLYHPDAYSWFAWEV